MKNNDNEKSKSKKNQSGSNTPPKKDVHSGGSVVDAVKTDVNDRLEEIALSLTDRFFDWIEQKISNLPESIKKLRNNSEIRQEIVSSFSQQLYTLGFLSKNQLKLSPEAAIEMEVQQIAYVAGLQNGYLLAMAAFAENGVSKDIIKCVGDNMPTILVRAPYNRHAENNMVSKEARERIKRALK